jgi:hypothetical protein
MESLFVRAIREHLELRERNARLEQVMPLERYRFHDDRSDAALVRTQPAVRLEDTDELPATRQPAPPKLDRSAPSGVFDDSWSGARSFDWGD